MTTENSVNREEDRTYRSLVIDSGPIIKLTGVSALRNKAERFYTVPAVLQEIRDAKARNHLENLPFDIEPRNPSPESIQAVTEFARLTGDYQSLSKVDMLVLALCYELEREGCEGSMDHVRTKPKRTVGVGKVELLNPKPAESKKAEEEEEEVEYDIVEEDEEEKENEEEACFFEGKPEVQEETKPSAPTANQTSGPKSWSMLVNPSAASPWKQEQPAVQLPPGKLNLGNEGQFSDAEDEEEETEAAEKTTADLPKAEEQIVEEELQLDFPSLAASAHVPFEGEDDEINNPQEEQEETATKEDAEQQKEKEEAEQQRKKDALKPLSKSGKTYNSFRGYGKLFKPAPPKKAPANTPAAPAVVEEEKKTDTEAEEYAKEMEGQSRIIGGVHMSGQEATIEDDGEGWITCSRDIRTLQATGTLAPPKNGSDGKENKGPPLNQRTACATTDFAMQNVLLQMNLELVSVDGVKIRKLKNWVTRCGACFKVYTKNDDAGPHGMKRLFCERCGSDMLQRIACSVDGKTGRLRLHMSKKYKNNTRGTKFSLPKPGTGNRFQGDLLLREDQLYMGAWNQKAKMRSGGKAKSAAQSMFGQDIAANVGCKAKSMNVDDLAAGFGRRNPNSAKGRERRGKKKKSKDQKACGLRRYH